MQGQNHHGDTIPDKAKRKDLYSISYFPCSSSHPLAQNAPKTQVDKASDASKIFYEYRSASKENVSSEDFLNNYYGNLDSNSGDSPLAKICKMELATPITIGNCVINGERNYIDINDDKNKTRIHIDNDGARDLENYRILVKEVITEYKDRIDFKSLDREQFKELEDVSKIKTFLNYKMASTQSGQFTNDNKILDAFADTFISNHLKAGRFNTEKKNADGAFEEKDFAYVKIQRPISDEKKINVTVSDIHSEKLNSININAGQNSEGREVFFQLSLEKKGDKQAIAQICPADSLKFFTKNKDGTFREETIETGCCSLDTNKLGDAKDKIINIFIQNELKYKIKKGVIDPQCSSFFSKEKCGEAKEKCGEANYLHDHEFMREPSRSVSPQAGAGGGSQTSADMPPSVPCPFPVASALPPMTTIPLLPHFHLRQGNIRHYQMASALPPMTTIPLLPHFHLRRVNILPHQSMSGPVSRSLHLHYPTQHEIFQGANPEIPVASATPPPAGCKMVACSPMYTRGLYP